MSRAAVAVLMLALAGCELPHDYPCNQTLTEGWVRHVPTGEYRWFDVFDFSQASVRAMDGTNAVYPPVCSEYVQVNKP